MLRLHMEVHYQRKKIAVEKKERRRMILLMT
jgi:hypothetical protein